MVKRPCLLGPWVTLVSITVLATSGLAFVREILQIKEDFSGDVLSDCELHYYYVPCPTTSYFYAWSGWEYGDILGQFFVVDDQVCAWYTLRLLW